MNALTLALRLVKLGFIPAEHFIGNGNDVVMTESGARALGIYSQFYFHMTSENGQDNDPAPTTRTLEEEIGYAEKGARIMDGVSGEACKMALDHGRPIHAGHVPSEADIQLLGRVREMTGKHDLKVLVPDAPTPEPITEQIYSTKHLEQPGATHPDREVDLLIGTQRDSLLTSDVRTDRQVMHLRQGVGKTRPINATKAGTVLARSLVSNPFDTIMDRPKDPGEYLQGLSSEPPARSFMNSVPKPDPTGRTSLVGNRFTGESEGRPKGHPLDYLIDELISVLAFGDKSGILEYYREYLGTRDKPMFLRLRRAQQERVAQRELKKMLAAKREIRSQSIEKQFGFKPGSLRGL